MEPDSQPVEVPPFESEDPNAGHSVSESRAPMNPFETLRIRRFLLWLLVTSPPMLIALFTIPDAGLSDEREKTLVLVAAGIWMYGTMMAWMLVASRRKAIDLGLLAGRRLMAREYALTALMAVPVLLAASGFSLSMFAAISLVLPEDTFGKLMEVLESRMDSANSGAADLLALFVLLCVVAPPIEEFFFRGFLLNRCAAKWGLKKAIAGTAVLFAVIHGLGLGVIFLGFLTALIYVRTRSLAGPIVLHISNNVVAVIIQMVAFLSDSGDPTTAADIRTAFVFFGLPAFVIGVAILVVIARRYWPWDGTHSPYMASMSPPD